MEIKKKYYLYTDNSQSMCPTQTSLSPELRTHVHIWLPTKFHTWMFIYPNHTPDLPLSPQACSTSSCPSAVDKPLSRCPGQNPWKHFESSLSSPDHSVPQENLLVLSAEHQLWSLCTTAAVTLVFITPSPILDPWSSLPIGPLVSACSPQSIVNREANETLLKWSQVVFLLCSKAESHPE